MKIIFHSLRCLRSLLKGKLDQPFAFAAYEQHMKELGMPVQRECDGVLAKHLGDSSPLSPIMLPINCETKMTIFIGARLIDGSFRVNNMKHVEIFELARWHHMGVTNLARRSVHGRVFPIVSSVDVQYLEAIEPFQTIVARTQVASISGKSLVHFQQLESVDGTRVFATGIVRLSWLEKKSASLLSNNKPGSLEVKDALYKMGCSHDDVAEIEGASVSEVSMLNNSRYWGKQVSTYDRLPLFSDKVTLSPTALYRFYPSPLVTSVNNSDSNWRNHINSKTKDRKQMMRQ